MKKYTVATDVSPSEQLGSPDDIKVLAFVIGLNSPESFEQVGSRFPKGKHRYTLKKWAKSGKKYKRGFIKHAKQLRKAGNVLFGSSIVNCRAMEAIGRKVWEDSVGEIQAPSAHTKKGKPLIALGGYKVDGEEIPEYLVSEDDIKVLGWYAYELSNLHYSLSSIVREEAIRRGEAPEGVELDIIADNLPHEQGVKRNKATLLKYVLALITKGRARLVGVPEKGDRVQRDLLVDNLAGLRREITAGKWGEEKANKLFSMSSEFLPEEGAGFSFVALPSPE